MLPGYCATGRRPHARCIRVYMCVRVYARVLIIANEKWKSSCELLLNRLCAIYFYTLTNEVKQKKKKRTCPRPILYASASLIRRLLYREQIIEIDLFGCI